MAGSQEALFVVFDGPPGHEAGRFVDVEDRDGRNPAGGSGMEWSQRDGYWLLGPFQPRIVEVATPDYAKVHQGHGADWSEPSRPIRVTISTDPAARLVRDLPYRLVADADYVLTVGGVLKDRDGRFDGRNPDGGDALNELAQEGPVEYVRWPA